jgi:hypothetical protein
MSTIDRRRLRMGAVSLAILLLAACVPAASGPTDTGGGSAVSAPVAAPQRTPPQVINGATTRTPTTTPAATTSPAATALGCPDPGTTIALADVATLDPACLGIEVRVVGWWDRVSSLDGEAATLFPAVIRDRLPGTRASHRAGAWAPLQTEEVDTLDMDRLLGEWVTTSVRLEQDELCRWVFAPGGEWEQEPPTWTCPRHLQVLSAKVIDPPAVQLAACPDTDRPIRVERFVQTPRVCFGTRRVQLRGWFDTAYVVSGWIELWTPVPAWLWGHPMGRVPMLSPTSNPQEGGSLVLRIRPGSSVEHALRNRWVIATGHYARPSDTETCRARSLIEGTTRPPGAPTRAQAQAACAREFVLVTLRAGAPG